MIVNNIDITQFDAKLLRRYIQPTQISYDSFVPDDSLVEFIGKQRYGLKRLELSIEFYGDKSTVEYNKSNFMKALVNNPIIQFNKIPARKYIGHLESIVSQDQNYLYEILDLVLKVTEQSYETSIEFDSSIEIILRSTKETPVKLEITPNSNINTIEILGFKEVMKIHNLSAGVPIIIDGENMLVTENGENKFNDYDSWIFPSLEPGVSKIEILGNTKNRITYSPRWL